MLRRTLLSAALALFSVLPLAPRALAAEASLEQVLVESATTPKQHEALAAYYANRAAAARKEADAHREMGKTYGGVKGSQLATMKEHCEKLASLYDEEAKQYDMMASMQREMAK